MQRVPIKIKTFIKGASPGTPQIPSLKCGRAAFTQQVSKDNTRPGERPAWASGSGPRTDPELVSSDAEPRDPRKGVSVSGRTLERPAHPPTKALVCKSRQRKRSQIGSQNATGYHGGENHSPK